MIKTALINADLQVVIIPIPSARSLDATTGVCVSRRVSTVRNKRGKKSRKEKSGVRLSIRIIKVETHRNYFAVEISRRKRQEHKINRITGAIGRNKFLPYRTVGNHDPSNRIPRSEVYIRRCTRYDVIVSLIESASILTITRGFALPTCP